jgi:3-isopropylmalate/(R)-2-methylmalate dehydratase small subunit
LSLPVCGDTDPGRDKPCSFAVIQIRAGTSLAPTNMNPFKNHTGLVVPLDRLNVDTDQIIPKQFLKRVERTGFGEFLFYDWRFRSDGQLDPSFPLNKARYQGASILIAGKNFGCGSSREHAPWALADYGFRAIIAPSYADIFANNCLKNGLLPVTLDDAAVAELMRRAKEIEGYRATVDLEDKTVSDLHGFAMSFEIDDFQRYCLLEGLDDIGLTLKHESEITRFEQRHPSRMSASPQRGRAPFLT